MLGGLSWDREVEAFAPLELPPEIPRVEVGFPPAAITG
jgi:hypothetical protein